MSKTFCLLLELHLSGLRLVVTHHDRNVVLITFCLLSLLVIIHAPELTEQGFTTSLMRPYNVDIIEH